MSVSGTKAAAVESLLEPARGQSMASHDRVISHVDQDDDYEYVPCTLIEMGGVG